MDGFIVSYYYRNEWHQYNDGAVVKTGQMPEDAVTKERIIELNPSIKASMIKLTNPRNERSTNDAQGRVEIIVKGPVEKSNDKPKVEGGQRAILDLESKTKQSSQWGSNWGGAQASSIESKTGFYNTPDENDKEFWIKTMFPDAKLYEVHQLVMKKITHSCCGLKTMNGYIITYFNGKEWVQYDTGKVQKTHSISEDDPEYERIIVFDPPLLASEVKLTNPRSERSDATAQGRIEFIIVGPKGDPEKEARESDDKRAAAKAKEQEEADAKAAEELKKEKEAAEAKAKENEAEAAEKKKAAEEAKKNLEENGKLAIEELHSSTTQSSKWNAQWAGKNVGLKSKKGFYNHKDEKGKDFWITTVFPNHDVYEVDSLTLKKIEHDCCTKETLDGVTISFFYNETWHDYKDGNVVPTGQMPSDDVDRERVIKFNPPLKASMVKVFNARKDRSSLDAQGRLDFTVLGPVEKNQKAKAPEDAKKAILDLSSKTKQSSGWSAEWDGAKAVALDSTTGFYNTKEEEKKDFWIKTMFPEAQLYQVHQLILKKITHACCSQKTMNGFIITYFNGSDWQQYNEGDVVKTHQLPEDDPEYERIIAFDPPLLASEIKVTNPTNQRSHGSAQGRIEYLITGPVADPEKEAREADK